MRKRTPAKRTWTKAAIPSGRSSIGTRSPTRRGGRSGMPAEGSLPQSSTSQPGAESSAAEDESSGEGAGEESSGEYYPQRFHGCFSSQTVGEVVASFGERKKCIMEAIGLGGLRHLKTVQHHSRNLVYWLLRRLDTSRMRIYLGPDKYIELTEPSVDRVLGVRSRGLEIEISEAPLAPILMDKLHKDFYTRGPKCLPSLAEVKSVLLKDYGDDMSEEDEDRFVVAMAAFSCAHYFGPVDRIAGIPKNIWGFISDPNKVRRCNWGGYVLDVIKMVAVEVQSDVESKPFSIRLGGCWLYLELLYLDHKDLGHFNIMLNKYPRVEAYNKYKLTDLIAMDEVDKENFGRTLMRTRGSSGVVGSEGNDNVGASRYVFECGSSSVGCGAGTSHEETVEHIEKWYNRMKDTIKGLAGIAHEAIKKNYISQVEMIDSLFNSIEVEVEQNRYHVLRVVESVMKQGQSVGGTQGCGDNVDTQARGSRNDDVQSGDAVHNSVKEEPIEDCLAGDIDNDRHGTRDCEEH